MVGQLSGYVSNLSNQLAANKLDVNVVTYDDSATSTSTQPSGVKISRVTNPVKTHIGVLTWVLTLNQEVERAAANIFYDANKQVDLIDVYDWHFIPAAVTLKNALGIPFVYSAESLEDQRSPNAFSSYNMAIKSIEWLGFFEAKRASVKSQWMCEEVERVYQVPKEKISVISTSPDVWIKEVLKVYSSTVEAKKNGR